MGDFMGNSIDSMTKGEGNFKFSRNVIMEDALTVEIKKLAYVFHTLL